MSLNDSSDEIKNKKLNEDKNLNDEDYTDENEISSEEDENDDEEEDYECEMSDVDEPIKKKRGRKPKDKEENSLPTEKIQKKRGRKPKLKENVELDKIPKKRGRKPKEKIYSVKELPKTFFEENKNETLILHLPIKTLENDEINPLPSINNDNNYSIYNEEKDNYKINNENLLQTQLDLLDLNLLNEQNNYKFDVDDKLYESNDLIKTKPNEEEEFKPNKIIKKNLRNIMYEFINANNDKVWPDSTNIHCWWCCNKFNDIPCALPEYYKKEKFYVNGCFCSFNCTASYNFSKNDENMWERYSLLNLMYKKMYNSKFMKINLAPPREILKMFGGYMSIEEFRENSLKNDKSFNLIKPPLISIISKIEENISNNYKNIKNNVSSVNENILNKTQNTLKLKRNKPVTNPNNTLQSFMDLKIV
jgi:hypothetical protein